MIDLTDLNPQERAALARIEETVDPAKLRNFANNARRLKSRAVEEAAFRQLCFVQPEDRPGSLEHDVWQSIHALEEMLLEERGKTVRLSRTRQKIAKEGEAKTVADLTLKKDASAGFFDLLERKRPDLTFEAVVLRHSDIFDEEVRLASIARLSDANVDVEQMKQPVGGRYG